MKVTLYIDGEHNTVEVKDKIKSVLPDANYMIFHPADNVSKVTEFDRIKNMSVQEMTEIERLESKVNRLKQYDEERDIRLHARLTETARAESIKEFAERLKEKANYEEIWTGEEEYVFHTVEFDDIDNLVKEIIGEE